MSFDEVSPAADRLAYLRREISRLKSEAQELRRQIIMGRVPAVGHFHAARVERHVVLQEIEPAYDTAE